MALSTFVGPTLSTIDDKEDKCPEGEKLKNNFEIFEFSCQNTFLARKFKLNSSYILILILISGYLRGFNNECVKRFVPPKRKKCDEPHLKFGSYELQIGGRVVNYWCEEGWTLAPDEFGTAVCKLGVWSKPMPQCVRPGCEELSPPQNGALEYDLDGALVYFSCNSEEQIISGSTPVLGCDGQFWNASVPICIDKPVFSTSGSPQSKVANLYYFMTLVVVSSLRSFHNQINVL